MDRKSFFKTLIGGAAVAVIAPRALMAQIKGGSPPAKAAIDISKFPKGMSVSDVLDYYKQTGKLPYNCDMTLCTDWDELDDVTDNPHMKGIKF